MQSLVAYKIINVDKKTPRKALFDGWCWAKWWKACILASDLHALLLMNLSWKTQLQSFQSYLLFPLGLSSSFSFRSKSFYLAGPRLPLCSVLPPPPSFWLLARGSLPGVLPGAGAGTIRVSYSLGVGHTHHVTTTITLPFPKSQWCLGSLRGTRWKPQIGPTCCWPHSSSLSLPSALFAASPHVGEALSSSPLSTCSHSLCLPSSSLLRFCFVLFF